MYTISLYEQPTLPTGSYPFGSPPEQRQQQAQRGERDSHRVRYAVNGGHAVARRSRSESYRVLVCTYYNGGRPPSAPADFRRPSNCGPAPVKCWDLRITLAD
ncbi:hypothetical protein MRX96_053813 [Rhipicephalus microplus]